MCKSLDAFSNYFEDFNLKIVFVTILLTFVYMQKAIVIRTNKSEESSELHLTNNAKPVHGRNRSNRTSKFSSKFLNPTPPTPTTALPVDEDEDIDILVNLQSNVADGHLDNDFQRIRNVPSTSTTNESGKKRTNTTLKAKETLIR